MKSACQGLYVSEQPLDDGTTVLADETHLVDSIIDPHPKQVAGWPNEMSVVAVPDEVVVGMVAYLMGLTTPYFYVPMPLPGVRQAVLP
jgi:hypothetical protein